MIYIVLGMHKSGTTLISETLHHSGVNMVENRKSDRTYDQGNFYERTSIQEFNREILGVKPFINGFTLLDLPAPNELAIDENLRKRLCELIQTNNLKYRNWGFKDPRTCFTYPIWASELPEHKIIAAYRSPSEIWARLRRHPIYHNNLYRAWKFINRWYEHNINILNYLHNTNMQYLVLSFSRLVATRHEFNRFQHFMGRKLEDRRVKGLLRNRPQEYPLLSLATWLFHKITGNYPREIVLQYAKLRQKE
jgi:hypothetical protein